MKKFDLMFSHFNKVPNATDRQTERHAITALGRNASCCKVELELSNCITHI